MLVMRAFLFLLAATVTISLTAEEITVGTVLDELSTAEGKTYTGAKITRIDGDSITIMHSGGIARVPAEFLPTELLEKLGFTAENVTAARKKEAADQREMNSREAEAARVAFGGQRMSFKVSQVVEGGLLVRRYHPGGRAGGAAQAMRALGGSGSSYVAPRTEDQVLYLSAAPTEGIVDDAIIEAYVAPLEDTHQYETVLGSIQTVKALEFLRWAD